MPPGDGGMLAATMKGQAAARVEGLPARAGAAAPVLEKRINEKCPKGGIARRSMSRMPSQCVAQCA